MYTNVNLVLICDRKEKGKEDTLFFEVSCLMHIVIFLFIPVSACVYCSFVIVFMNIDYKDMDDMSHS